MPIFGESTLWISECIRPFVSPRQTGAPDITQFDTTWTTFYALKYLVLLRHRPSQMHKCVANGIEQTLLNVHIKDYWIVMTLWTALKNMPSLIIIQWMCVCPASHSFDFFFIARITQWIRERRPTQPNWTIHFRNEVTFYSSNILAFFQKESARVMPKYFPTKFMRTTNFRYGV